MRSLSLRLESDDPASRHRYELCFKRLGKGKRARVVAEATFGIGAIVGGHLDISDEDRLALIEILSIDKPLRKARR